MIKQWTIRIDGNEFDVGVIDAIFQRDPFPAGHVYELSIFNPDQYDLELGEYGELTVGELMPFFWDINHFHATSGSVRREFILNNVLSATIGSHVITLRGVCSPFVLNK